MIQKNCFNSFKDYIVKQESMYYAIYECSVI